MSIYITNEMNIEQTAVFESINQIGEFTQSAICQFKNINLKGVKLKQITKSYYNLKQNNKFKLYPKTSNFY